MSEGCEGTRLLKRRYCGNIHEYQKDRDNWREEIIEGQGIKVIRVRNEELRDAEKLINKIKFYLPDFEEMG